MRRWPRRSTTEGTSTISPCERWPRDMRRKCWVMPRQRRICSRAMAALSRTCSLGVRARSGGRRAGCLRRTSARSPAVCSARARSRKRECPARPGGAIRPGAPRRRAARRCRATPPPLAADCPDGSRIGEACISSHTTPVSPCGARRCAPAARRFAGTPGWGSPRRCSRRAPARGSSSPAPARGIVRHASETRRWRR